MGLLFTCHVGAEGAVLTGLSASFSACGSEESVRGEAEISTKQMTQWPSDGPGPSGKGLGGSW